MSGLSFKCKDLGFRCDFEVKGVATREEMVGIIASHGKRCHDLEAITPELEGKVSKAIAGRTG
jgi:predicted small metal-binding protein